MDRKTAQNDENTPSTELSSKSSHGWESLVSESNTSFHTAKTCVAAYCKEITGLTAIAGVFGALRDYKP